jgi:hypothetical protein
MMIIIVKQSTIGRLHSTNCNPEVRMEKGELQI